MPNNKKENINKKQMLNTFLLFLEILLGSFAIIILLLSILIFLLITNELISVIFAVAGFIPLVVVAPFLIKIEQIAGYYKCNNCTHTFTPTYKQVFLSPHFGWTRYMKCPKCNKKSWKKKITYK